MSAQIFFLTGENAYQLSLERRRWIGEFSKKYGAENVSRMDGTSLTYPRLLDEAGVLPFTASKRLVVIEGIPPLSKEEVERLPGDIHPKVLLLVVDSTPDRRKSATKAFFAVAEVRECTPLLGAALDAWVREAFAREGSSILPDALRALFDVVGVEQIALHQEIRKLALYAANRPVTTEDVAALVLPAGERNALQLMNLLGEGDPRRAIAFVRELTARGETAAGLWSMLLWTVARIAPVAAAADQGARSPQDVMKKAGVKFGTARSLLPMVRRMDRERLRTILCRFARAEIDLKTGALRNTAEAPQEVEALLDVCLAELCRSS